MKALVALLAVAVVAIAGCSSTSKGVGFPTVPFSSQAEAPPETLSPSPTPSPTPTVWTMAQAQAQYLAFVAPSNVDIDTYDAVVKPATPNLTSLKAICGKLAVDDDTLAREINAGLWPDSAKTATAAFVVALTSDRAAYQSCNGATSLDGAYIALQGDKAGGAAAEGVRIALGLPGTS